MLYQISIGARFGYHISIFSGVVLANPVDCWELSSAIHAVYAGNEFGHLSPQIVVKSKRVDTVRL